MNAGKDLAHMVQAQIQLEESAAQKIKKLEKATANLAAKLFLAEMRFDTEKHAKILQTILDIMKQKESEIVSRPLWTTKIHSYVDALVAKKDARRSRKGRNQNVEACERGNRKDRRRCFETFI